MAQSLKNVQFQVFNPNTTSKKAPINANANFKTLPSLQEIKELEKAALEKEKQKKILLYSAFGGVTLLTVGLVIYAQKKKKNKS